MLLERLRARGTLQLPPLQPPLQLPQLQLPLPPTRAGLQQRQQGVLPRRLTG